LTKNKKVKNLRNALKPSYDAHVIVIIEHKANNWFRKQFSYP